MAKSPKKAEFEDFGDHHIQGRCTEVGSKKKRVNFNILPLVID